MGTMAIIIGCGTVEQISSGVDTAFLSLGNQPLLAHSLQVFHKTRNVESVFLVVGKDRIDSTLQIVKRFGFTKVKGIVAGSSTRLSSLRGAMAKIQETPTCVVLHEASRPFVSVEIVDETIKAAKRYGCAIAAHRIQDAVKTAAKGLKVEKTLERNTSWLAQSPQAFKADVLKKILDSKNRSVKLIDDESGLITGNKADVHMIEAGPENLKIRSSRDLAMATALYNARQSGRS